LPLSSRPAAARTTPIPPSTPPPHEPEAGSIVLRFGSAVGLASAAALACAVPPALRISAALGADGTAATPPTGRAWIGLAAAALVPMVGTVIVLRGAREGLRAFGGAGAELRAYGGGLWAASLFVMLAYFGSVLRATTHHHALAGVTFAFGAVVLAVASALACARVTAILRGVSEERRRVLVIALGLAALAAVSWTGFRFLRAASHDPASAPAAGNVVDVLAFGLAAFFAAGHSLASRRPLALVGPPAAVAIAALGISVLRDAPLRTAIDDGAPAFAPIVDQMPGP
jgi:hypothetical protein